MRRQTPIAHTLYNHLFPHPTPSDPPSFAAHLARNLVPEVRLEVATFYGDLNSVEARYPGLNYCYAPHRMRLGRFKHHRRLFEAFDELGLTYQEIQDFCCWEGSRWARLKYEEDQGEKVIDTTGDEIGPWVDRRDAEDGSFIDRRESITRKTDIEVVFEDAIDMRDREIPPQLSSDERLSDSLAHSDAPRRRHAHSSRSHRMLRQLQQRVIYAFENGESVPAEIEAMVKEQVESGYLDPNTLHMLTSARAQALGRRYITTSVRPLSQSTAAASWNYESPTAA